MPKVFSHIALYRPVAGNLGGADEPDRIASQGVTGDFFPALGVTPFLGRTFAQTDEVPGVAPMTVISYGLWKRRLGESRAILGRHLLIDGDDYAIVGVMGPEFVHPGSTRAAPVDLWYLTGFSASPFSKPSRRSRPRWTPKSGH
jgi:hypothetical protein